MDDNWLIALDGLSGWLGLRGSGRGKNNAGIDRAIKAVPTVSNTHSGPSLTRGCFSKTLPQRKQIGVSPGGGCKTTAGPQQHSGQRKRGMCFVGG